MPPKRKTRDASPERPKTERHIFVVFRGEAYEGGKIEALFTSREEARVHARHLVDQTTYRRDRWEHDVEENYWHNGCDYIEIQEEPIFDTYARWKTWYDSLPVTVIGQQPNE